MVCAILAFILGTVGNLQYQQMGGEVSHLGNAMYHTAQLFMLHSPHFSRQVPWFLELARWLAPITITIGLVDYGRGLLRQETTHHFL